MELTQGLDIAHIEGSNGERVQQRTFSSMPFLATFYAIFNLFQQLNLTFFFLTSLEHVEE